ncbi:MAG TPA: hypothetical protein VGM94_00615 [Galbitalea sp.]|jgi:predicted RNase H-like HicB family nuclease
MPRWTDMLARIWQDGEWWLAEWSKAAVMTQGKTRDDAKSMLADAIESLVNEEGFKVTIDEIAGGSTSVLIRASDQDRLKRLVQDRA